MTFLDLSGMSILLVDDERFSRTTVARFLDDMGQPDVIHAEHGKHALDLLQHEAADVDIIVCDINMPVMHGLQLLRAVRMGEGGVNRALPFAMVTGHSDKHLVDMALALDVNAFLIKPVSKKSLTDRLSRMLKQTSQSLWLKPSSVYQAVFTEHALDHLATTPATHGPTGARGIFTDRTNEPLFRPTRPHPLSFSKSDHGKDASIVLKDDVSRHQGMWRFEPPEGQEGNREGKWKYEPPDGQSSGQWRFEPPEGQNGQPSRNWSFEPPESQEASDTELDEAPALKPGLILDGYICPLNELPEDAILARDFYTVDGRLFMYAGTTLTPRIISILSDLSELGHGIDSIWVANFPVREISTP